MKNINMLLTLLFLFVAGILLNGCHSRTEAPKITPQGWFDAGTTWAEKGEYDKAIDSYNKALKMDPLYTGAYFYRAQMWEEKGEYKKAIKDYNKVLKISPNLEKAYNYRGGAWQMKGESDKAVEDYTKALEINPDNAVAYHNRGNVWGKKGNYDKAIEDFNKAAELSPREPAIYDNRGNAWSKKGDYKRAIADYNRALEIDSNFGMSCNNLAWLLATVPDSGLRDGNRAVQLAQKALTLLPDISTSDTLAAAYAEAGNFDEAVRTMERLILLLRRSKTEDLTPYLEHLNAYKARKPWRIK